MFGSSKVRLFENRDRLLAQLSTHCFFYQRQTVRIWNITITSFQSRHNGRDSLSITSLTILYSTVYSGADQRKHHSSASLVIVRGMHRWPVNSPHKWPVTRKIFPFDDVIMIYVDMVVRVGVHSRLCVSARTVFPCVDLYYKNKTALWRIRMGPLPTKWIMTEKNIKDDICVYANISGTM